MRSTLAILVLGAMAHTASAVGICTQHARGGNPDNPMCAASSCQIRNINFRETINDLGAQISCIFNSAANVGFDAQVCAGANLQGQCVQLSQLSSRVINGDRNWQPPFTIRSMRRTGN